MIATSTRFLAAGAWLWATGAAAGLEVFDNVDDFQAGIADLGPVTLEDFEASYARFLPGEEFASCVEPVTNESADSCFGPDDLVEGIRISSSNTWGLVVPNPGRLGPESIGISAWPFRVSPPTLNFTVVAFDPPMLAVAADVYGYKIEGGVPNGEPVDVVVEAFDTQGGLVGSVTLEPQTIDQPEFIGLRADVPIGRVEFGTRVEIAGEMIDNLRFAGGPGRLVAIPERGVFPAAVPGGTTELSVDLVNAGFQEISVTGLETTDSRFALASGDCPGAELAPGASCQQSLEFTPTAEGAYHGVLVTDSGLEVPLSGDAQLPWLRIDPAEVDFGQVAVGAVSDPVEVVLSNPRAVTVTVDALDAPASPFQIVGGMAGDCPEESFALDPGGACTIQVTFAPEVPGPVADTLRVQTDAFTDTDTIPLAGAGLEATASAATGSPSHE